MKKTIVIFEGEEVKKVISLIGDGDGIDPVEIVEQYGYDPDSVKYEIENS